MRQKQLQIGFIIAGMLVFILLKGVTGAQGDIIRTIAIDYALSIGINTETDRAYVGGDEAIVVLDTATNQIIDTIPTDVVSFYIATNPVTNRIYATDSNHIPYHLLVIDGEDHSVDATIEISGSPNGIAVDTTRNLIYVTSSSLTAGELLVIDGSTDTIIDSILIGDGPGSVAVNPITNRIYVASNANTISVVDGVNRTVLTTVSVGTNPNSVTVNTFTNTIYVSSSSTTTALGVIDGDTNTLIDSVPIEDYGGNKVVANSIINRVYFLTAPYIGDYSTILVFDGTTHSIIDRIVFAGTSYDLAPNELTSRVYAITRLQSTLQGNIENAVVSPVKDGGSDHFRIAIPNISLLDSINAAQVNAGNTIAVYQDIRPPLVAPTRYYFRTSTPTLTWNRVSWSTGYEIQVDNNADFKTNEYHRDDLSSDQFSITTTALADGQYYWRVRARRADGITWGNWSVMQTFAVNA